MNRPKHQRYFRVFTVFVVTGLLILVATNLVIDPYGAYRIVSIPEFATSRDEQYVAVAERFRHQRPKAVVVGSSRVVDGIDPDICDELGWPVCPVAVRGTAWKEQRQILTHLIRHDQKPAQIVFAFDLDTVLRKSRPSDFDQSLFSPSLRAVDYHSQNLLSLHALKQSIDVAMHAFSNKRRTDDRIDQLVKQQGSFQIFRQQLSRDIDMHEPTETMTRIDDSIQQLEDLVIEASRREIDFRIVFLPVHALSYEKLTSQGYGDCVETLKRRTADVCSRRDIPLWDFTGYTEITTEPVPQPNEPSKLMRWFYDSDHFTPQLGKLVMTRVILDDAKYSANKPSGKASFGKRLTSDNVEAHLLSVRKQRINYLNESPAELDLLNSGNRSQTVSRGHPAKDAVNDSGLRLPQSAYSLPVNAT